MATFLVETNLSCRAPCIFGASPTGTTELKGRKQQINNACYICVWGGGHFSKSKKLENDTGVAQTYALPLRVVVCAWRHCLSLHALHASYTGGMVINTLPWQYWKSRFKHCHRSYGFPLSPANSFGQSARNLFSDGQLFHGTIRLARAITWYSL